MLDEIGGDFLQRLRGFYFVAKTGSVTRAAEFMGRNQSTISVQIRKLEAGLGVSLFKRSKKSMQLTDAGFGLYKKTLVLFETVKEIQQDVGIGCNTFKGSIQIAASNQLSAYYLPEYIVAFRKHHPEVYFSFFSDSHDGLVHNVEESESDFGIVADHGYFQPSLLYTELFTSSLVLLTPEKEEFAISKKFSLQDIVRMPFIGFSATFQIHKLTQRLFEEAGVLYQPVIQVPSYNILIQYVAMGAGATILDKFIFDKHCPDGIRVYPLEGLLPHRHYGLIQRRRKYHAPQTRAFMDFLLSKRL